MSEQNSQPSSSSSSRSPRTRTYRSTKSLPKKTSLVGEKKSKGISRGSRPFSSSHSPQKDSFKKSGGPRGNGGRSGGPRNSSSNNRKRRGAPAPGTLRRRLKKAPKPSSVKTAPRIETMKNIPPLADGDLRIVPICGVEWIGTNMTLVEYKDEIIIIDAGFGFSNPDTPGIDYTLPDTTYLEANKHKIKGLVITHGHLDHVGGIPYIIEKIGNPTIYTREFGAIFIQKRMEEFPHAPKLNIVTIDNEEGYVSIGEHLQAKFFGLTHSIPDSTGVVIKTPLGGIVSTGDVRVENENGEVHQEEIDQYAFFKDEDILLMTCDSTGIPKPGWSISEDRVAENVDKIMKSAKGRLFIASFSSQVERLMTFIDAAKKHNKHVAIEGRSMKSNLGIAEHLKLTDFSHVISINEIDDYPPHKVVVLITGSQGEEFSALNRMANESHRTLKLTPSDTIVLSSSVVPGNDWAVKKLKDNLYRGSYHIVTYQDEQVHASGHGTREELKWIHTQIPYKFFIPVHGDHYMLKMHATMAHEELGVPKENIVVPDNGSIIEIRDGGKKIVKLKEQVPHEMVVVDGSMVGVLPDVVMRDRKLLSESGMFVTVVAIDSKTGKVRKSPDIISRGFIYLRENQRLLNEVRDLIKNTVEKETRRKKRYDFEDIKKAVAEDVAKFLFQKTAKEPIIIPVVLSM